MFLYTLGFIIRKDEVLMLNRNFKPWMGSWNGVGGKRKQNETALQCIIRETKEETGITIRKDIIEDKGVVVWDNKDSFNKGLHIFIIRMNDRFKFEAPIHTKEGLLDWKKIAWVNDKENIGVSHNIPYFLPIALNEKYRYKHICTFSNGILLDVKKERID